MCKIKLVENEIDEIYAIFNSGIDLELKNKTLIYDKEEYDNYFGLYHPKEPDEKLNAFVALIKSKKDYLISIRYSELCNSLIQALQISIEEFKQKFKDFEHIGYYQSNIPLFNIFDLDELFKSLISADNKTAYEFVLWTNSRYRPINFYVGTGDESKGISDFISLIKKANDLEIGKIKKQILNLLADTLKKALSTLQSQYGTSTPAD